MDERSKRPGTHRALVTQKSARGLDKAGRPLPLGKLPNGGKFISDAFPERDFSGARRKRGWGSRLSRGTGFLLVAMAALIYARLLVGPISLTFLVPTVQKQINSELMGYSFHARDALLRLVNGWRLEFRLADVRLLNESNQELAKAPFASVAVSARSLAKLSLAPAKISLIGPKLLVFNMPGKGLTLTAPPSLPGEQGPGGQESGWSTESLGGDAPYSDLAAKERLRAVAGSARADKPNFNAQAAAERLNPAPLLGQLFTALKARGAASSALEQIGIKDALIYFATDKGVSVWGIPDFHINLEEAGSESALRGELTLGKDKAVWRASFRAVDQRRSGVYSVTAAIQDFVPRALWQSFPVVDALKVLDAPVSGEARFDIARDGTLLGGEAELKLGTGKIYGSNNALPTAIDSVLLKASYDQSRKALLIKPFEARWEGVLFTLGGAIAFRNDPATNQPFMTAELDGTGTVVSAPEFGVGRIPVDTLRISASYHPASDIFTLKELAIAAAGASASFYGQATQVSALGPLKVNGSASSIPLPLMKGIWPSFFEHNVREWVGKRVSKGRVTGATLSLNSSGTALLALLQDGDIPDSAFTFDAQISDAEVQIIEGLPSAKVKDSAIKFAGRHFSYEVAGEARAELPSGRSLSFTGAQFAIDDLRPEIVDGEIRFKGVSDVATVLDLLNQPPLDYVKSVGFDPSLVNGQVAAGFRIGFPVTSRPKMAEMTLAAKARVSDLKSASLPGGFSVNGGTINFDISQTSISANGDLKVNNVPVTLAWQRMYDAPPERQPTLRLASILNEKARDELGLNINHIIKGDLPVALGVAMQADGPPRFFMEANLTGTDVFLTAAGWRKAPGQKASLTFDVNQRADNSIALENFALTGDGLAVNGWVVLNSARRIAAFSFPEFSTNALTQVAINGELTPQNVLKVQAKGPSYDARQFLRSLFTAGKIAENQPAPLKDEPGLDLNIEFENVFGFNDATIKSVVLEARRRAGKLSYLECNGRLDGQSPIAVHVEQKPGRSRILTSNATDAGAALRLVGLISTARGGALDLRVDLDGSGNIEKAGVIDIHRFEIIGDEVVGRVVSQAARDSARIKPEARAANQQASGERMVFDRAVAHFAIGANEFQIRDAAINGPEVGATLRGHIDFPHDMLALSGTYVPLYGLNSVLQNVPIINMLLGGRENEGVFGITFAIQGRTSNPEIVVNPASMLAPGILRQIFEFDNHGQGGQ
jgi:hypothetical protein